MRESPVPTPTEIAAECMEIQKEWSPEMFILRARGDCKHESLAQVPDNRIAFRRGVIR